MRKTAFLGIGQTRIDEHWDKSLREIGGDAAFSALQDAGLEKVEALFVGNMIAPIADGQNQLGAYFADWLGLWKKEAVRIEAACGSGAAAFRAALMAVASGDVDSLRAGAYSPEADLVSLYRTKFWPRAGIYKTRTDINDLFTSRASPQSYLLHIPTSKLSDIDFWESKGKIPEVVNLLESRGA